MKQILEYAPFHWFRGSIGDWGLRKEWIDDSNNYLYFLLVTSSYVSTHSCPPYFLDIFSFILYKLELCSCGRVWFRVWPVPIKLEGKLCYIRLCLTYCSIYHYVTFYFCSWPPLFFFRNNLQRAFYEPFPISPEGNDSTFQLSWCNIRDILKHRTLLLFCFVYFCPCLVVPAVFLALSCHFTWK